MITDIREVQDINISYKVESLKGIYGIILMLFLF